MFAHGFDVSNGEYRVERRDATASVCFEKFVQIKSVEASIRREHAKIFGRKLKQLRLAAKLTQEALAEKADVSAIYVRQVELGSRLPSIAIANALRKGVGASWEALMGK